MNLLILCFFSRSFSMPCASFAMLDGHGGTGSGTSSIKHEAHGIEKLPLKNSSKLSKFLHSEVNLLIQHIIMQDQDGQNKQQMFFPLQPPVNKMY